MYLYTPKPTYGQLWGLLNLSFFLFHRKEEKMKQINTLNISDFINNVQIIYIIHIFITELYMVHGFFATEHSTR